MSPNDNPKLAISANTKLKTPLKASVILLTSVILAACGSSGSESYNLDDVFGSSPTVGGASQAELDKLKQEKEAALEKAEAERKAKEAAEAAAAEQKAKAEAAEAAAAEQKAKAEAAQQAAADAKTELDKLQAELDKAKQDLEDALAAGGGNTEYFEAQVELRENELKAAQEALEAANQQAESAQAQAEAQAEAAATAQQAAEEALAAAAIKNTPETDKTGVQTLNVEAAPLNKIFNTTTRDFEANENSVVARADIASQDENGSAGLLPAVNITISGDGDADTDNGFKVHTDNAVIPVEGIGELPLTYTSTYKDFGDDMRIGHIDGKAEFSGIELPVNGAAVIGNATQAQNVPTEGQVGYTGDATHRKLGIGNAIEYGSSVFTADFVQKSLAGKLSFADAGDINLKASISGNQFSGAAADNAGYLTEGGFYGGDAQYLGGVYEGNGAQGTYGATSDNQAAAEQAAADAKAKAEAAQKALKAEQEKAEAAQAAAAQAQADAAEAQKALEAAKDALANAGDGGNDQALQEALEKAQAEAEQAKADAAKAIAQAQENAQQEVAAAQEQLAAAQKQVETAKEAADAAEAVAATATAAAAAAKKEAEEKIAAAETAAEEDVAAANKLAEEAKAEAKAAEEKAAAAEADKLQAQNAAQEAEDKATAALAAQAEAEERIKALEAELDALKNPDAYRSEAEADKSGAQHLRVDATAVSDQLGVKESSSREFTIRSTSDVDARADLALEGIVSDPVAIQVSGDADTDTNNGFKAYEGTASVLGTDNLTYTSTYKDFGDDEMRIAHIDGVASIDIGAGPTEVPVDGVAVVGNKTITLPTEGTAEYAGDATNRKVGLDNAIEYGSSEFTADFVAKSLDGTLKFKQSGEIGLSATITDNEFSGSAADNNGYTTEGAFYGKNANLIGGIYEGNESQGTYGATKDGTPAELVEPAPVTPAPNNPDAPPSTEATGVMSNTLSSVETSYFGIPVTDNAIGYRQFITDKQTFNETTGPEDDPVPVIVEEDAVDNIQYNSIEARVDIVQPAKFPNTATLTTVRGDDVSVAGTDFMKSASTNEAIFTGIPSPIGDVELIYAYDSVYRNFDSVMQIGHVYGDIRKDSGTASGVKSRYANAYVVGNATSLEDMSYMNDLAQYNIDNGGDGIVQYQGVATYTDKVHLGSGELTMPTLNGTSNFDVDFVNKSLEGQLEFADIGKQIQIAADIEGNKFSNDLATTGYGPGVVDVSGGFYGADAQYLGGIYQEAQAEGGKGTVDGTGSAFQGTFGAEKK